MPHVLKAALLGIVLPALLSAQSRTGVALGGLAGVFQGIAIDRANAQQRRADSIAYAARVSILREEQAAKRAADAQARRADSIAWALYLPRAMYLMGRAADSLSLNGLPLKEYHDRTGTALAGLYEISPQASNAQIADALAPIVADFANRKKVFNDRVVYSLLNLVSEAKLTDAEAGESFQAVSDSIWALSGRGLRPMESEVLNAISPPFRAYVAGRPKPKKKKP